MSKLKYMLLATLWVASWGNLSAQYTTAGLDLDGDIAAWYDQVVGQENSRALEGTYYKLEYAALDKNPYFQGAQWVTGTLEYNGQTYDQVSLLYNAYKDQVLIRNTTLKLSTIEPTLLNQQKIDGFLIYDRQFVHLKEAETPEYGSGFYERFYQGDTISFYIKRIKNEYIRSGKMEFVDEDKYYLFDGKKFTKYTGKKNLYKTFPNLKNQLKSFSANLRLNLKRGEEEDMLSLLVYCDKLLMEK